MNYPNWDVAFGPGLLIAIVAITHVFVSHFAIGGGLFLVLTESRAYRKNDMALLDWLKRHTKFFVLVTVVFGALSGVGIWFTISLIQPSATSSLIHAYVWGWAIEWVFFFLEITAALLYLYGWEKLDRKTHLGIGWIYFITAFLSMVIINGILTFMLTSGNWVNTFKFWQGFFNPTYFPSLAFRFVLALALAGVYALVTGTRQQDEALKQTIVRWSGTWLVPALVVLPFLGLWYISAVPAELWAHAQGKMPTASNFARITWIFAALTFLMSLPTLIRPKKIPFVYSLLLLITAFVMMGGFEFVREAIRKPYIINNFMYGNSILVKPVPHDAGMNLPTVREKGLLQVARWTNIREIKAENRKAAGKEIFRIQCMGCHTENGYRGIRGFIEQKKWGFRNISGMLTALHRMHNGAMPPFAGTEAERNALAAYLAGFSPVQEEIPAEAPELTGPALFENYCQTCHEPEPEDPLFVKFQNFSAPQIEYLMTRLDSLNEEMPELEITGAERTVLAEWIKAQF